MRHTLATILALATAMVATAHDDDLKVLDRRPPWSGPGHVPGTMLNKLRATTPGNAGGTLFGLGNQTGTGSITFPKQGVQLLSWMPVGWIDPASSLASDCWGYVSPAGREYAIIGMDAGTGFVDVTDPSAPTVTGVIPGMPSTLRDIKTFRTYAYCVTEADAGIQIIDLSQIDAGQVSLANTVTAGGELSSHNVVIDEVSGFLYRTGGGSNGLRAYDLNASPTNPALVGQWNLRYVHDAQVVTYTTGPHAGRQVAFCCGGFNGGKDVTGLIVLDVTDKNNIVVLDYAYYPNAGYTHQGWLSPDRRHFYVNDERITNSKNTRTIVMDVSDLTDVRHVSDFYSDARSISHNLYEHDGKIFASNYRSGLRVFDASTALAPTEIAWFDTWPGDDAMRFNGVWSNYPFFPSGVVIGSDMEKGLFTWWIGEAQVSFSYPQGRPEIASTTGATIPIQLAEDSPGDLMAGSERLYYDAGNGVVEVPLTALGSGLYEAPLPALEVGQELRWFVGAKSTNGILWTSPAEAPYSNWWALGGDGAVTMFDDDVEQDAGWSVGATADTATTGVWERGDPPGSPAEPYDDHTSAGAECWFTDAQGTLDGKTTLTSPALLLAGAERPIVTFWYWLFNRSDNSGPGVDDLTIRLSNDNGASWTSVQDIGVTPEELGTWSRHAFAFPVGVIPTDGVLLQFEAEATGSGIEMEVAIDDLLVVQPWGGCDWQSYCVTSPNSVGTGALIGASGSTSLATNDLILNASGLPPGQFGMFFYGSGATQKPIVNGFLCITGSLFRYTPQRIDSSGNVSLALDLTSPPAQAGQVLVGSEWRYQLWYRDPAAGGAGSNLTDGLRVRFCP
ncbi:MAG TPA: choice-of-anchor B family protein [Planctomycetes bacterium]|nr:choice-of-anchor B family protein [Planctomycetota bacterium]HIK61635.1 choice-of-anchor B family protein [Planctomycetota bacterium]